MKTLLVFSTVLLLSTQKTVISEPVEKYTITTDDLVKRHGYDIDDYNVTTEDGYILTLNRIINPRENDSTLNKSVVLLIHGLLGSSDNFLVSHRGLAYFLSDSGFDVWLGNCRGNRYSRKHITLNPDTNKKFWNFSWHEIGIYDLPAMIDFILEETSQEDLFYIGHSQGTTTFFVMASERPEYNHKVKLMLALAPAVYGSYSQQNHIIPPIDYPFFANLARILNIHEMFPNNELLLSDAKLFCGPFGVIKELCSNFALHLNRYNRNRINKTDLPFIFGTFPAGASYKQFLHYLQDLSTGTFRQYDYGTRKNMLKYGTPEPPNYNLENVTAPVALLFSEDDGLTLPKDIEKLASKLPNLVLLYGVLRRQFNHIDFLLAVDAPVILYARMVEEMKKYLQ